MVHIPKPSAETIKRILKKILEVLLKHMNEVPIPPSEIPDGPPIPNALEQVILRCLEKSREARFPTVAHLAAEIVDKPRKEDCRQCDE